jgi:hypothetical protein
LISERSGDLSGIAFDVYGLGVMLSRAFADSASAAACMFAEALDLVAGAEGFGLSGRGGGARSGSELSHLGEKRRFVSFIIINQLREVITR